MKQNLQREREKTRWHSKDECASAHNNNNGIKCVRASYGMSIWYDFAAMFAHKCPNTCFVQFLLCSLARFFCIDFIYVSIFVSRPTSHVRIQLYTYRHLARKFSLFHKNVHIILDHAYRGTLYAEITSHHMIRPYAPYTHFIDVRFKPPSSFDRKLPHEHYRCCNWIINRLSPYLAWNQSR